MVWLDTNIIIRMFTGQPPEMAAAGARMVDRALAGDFRIRISPLVIAECLYVLSKQYGFGIADIADRLCELVARVDDGETGGRVTLALRLMTDRRIDFVDAWIAINARADGDVVASFDRDFRKIAGVAVFNPLVD